jgi:type IV pilus assembly protein PilA
MLRYKKQKKERKKMKKTNKGFSLVELIIVIAIMAILIGVLAPQYIKYVEKSRKSTDEETADEVNRAVMAACTDDEYNEGIDSGDTATFNTANGIQSAGNATLNSALLEFFGTDGVAKIPKSKIYKNSTYTVTVSKNASTGALTCSGAWN